MVHTKKKKKKPYICVFMFCREFPKFGEQFINVCVQFLENLMSFVILLLKIVPEVLGFLGLPLFFCWERKDFFFQKNKFLGHWVVAV